MSDDDQLSALTSQIADIELPPEPEWWPVYLFFFVVLSILISALQLVRLRYKRVNINTAHDVTQEAIQQLNQLQRQWQNKTCNDQNSAFRLAAILRLGLSLSQLSETLPTHLTQAETDTWANIFKQLHHLRYNPNSTMHLDPQVFFNCRQWLDQTAKHNEKTTC